MTTCSSSPRSNEPAIHSEPNGSAQPSAETTVATGAYQVEQTSTQPDTGSHETYRAGPEPPAASHQAGPPGTEPVALGSHPATGEGAPPAAPGPDPKNQTPTRPAAPEASEGRPARFILSFCALWCLWCGGGGSVLCAVC